MEDRHIVLQTKLGKLRGHTKKSHFCSNTYYAFQGIPYAKPPLGKLRFKSPEPFGGWEGIRDALEDGNVAKQPVFFPKPGMDDTQATEGSEDCLFLNVFTTELPENSSTKKPVMFSIHGGGFLGGSGSMKFTSPDLLMNGDVVVVTVNYRCGAFGFLSLENEEVPGNAGLKDQTMALKWVQDNIVSFGGDPNNVTIFGISAGGASVNFHLLSPSSKGLFHKAIVTSGFATNPWAFQNRPRALAKEMAKAMGCTSDNTDEILLFLQSAPADDIVVATKDISQNKEYMNKLGFLFTPSTEVSGKDPFLSDTPNNIMKKGQLYNVPVILGHSLNEASLLVFLGNRVNENEFSMMNNNPELLVPSFLGLKIGSVEEKEAGKSIWDFYFKGEPLSWDNVEDYLAYQCDFLFNIGKEQSRTCFVKMSCSSVYTYLFTNKSRCLCHSLKSTFPVNEKLSKLIAAETCHGADFAFTYTSEIIQSPEISPDHEPAIKNHVKALTTFALFGDPNFKDLGLTWEKDTKDKPCFMEIGTTWNMKEGIAFANRMDFWKKLTSKYCTI